jgi:hypothetical protein
MAKEVMADAENKAKLNSFLNDIVRVGSVQVSGWVLVRGCVRACVRACVPASPRVGTCVCVRGMFRNVCVRHE